MVSGKCVRPADSGAVDIAAGVALIRPLRFRCRIWIHEIQYRYSEPFLGQTPFEEVCLSLVKIEFEQSLIPSDVQLVGAQERRSFLVHSATRS